MRSNLQYALGYAAKGWPVFPCRKDTKRPFMTGGFHKATTDEWTVTQWWTQWPEAMIGVPMGNASGIWAVDCDGEEGIGQFAELCGKHGYEPATLSQTSPKGGRHFLFSCPKNREIRCSVRKVAPDIDIRAEGGYVIVAPSFRIDGKEYSWDNGLPIAEPPSWLVEEAVKANARTAQSRYGMAALRAEADKVAAAPEGERNDTLNKAAFAIGTLVGGGEISRGDAKAALLEAAIRAGLPQAEAENTIESGLKAGMDRPRSAPAQQSETAADAYIIQGDDFISREYGYEPAVEGLFDQGEIVLINARSGTGKGLLTMQLALEMGSAPDTRDPMDFNERLLWGRFRIPKMRRTLFVQAENRCARTQEKLNMMLAADPSYGPALKNMGYLSYDNVDIRTRGDFTKDAYLSKVMEMADSHRYDTVIFDPLISFLGADENDNQEVDEALQRLIEWQKKTNVTCILVHHIGKNEGDLDGRGASAIRAKADTLIAFTRDPKRQIRGDRHATVITGHFQKIRHARDGFSIDFRRDDGGFRLLPMQVDGTAANQSAENVISVLKSMGGACGTAMELKSAVAEAYAVSQRTSERWIAEALRSGCISPAKRKGCRQGYELLKEHDSHASNDMSDSVGEIDNHAESLTARHSRQIADDVYFNQ